MDAGISPCFLVFSCRILNDAHTLRCSALFCLAPEGCGSGKVPAFSTKTAEFVEKAPAGPVLGSFWGQTPKFLRLALKAKEKAR